MNFIEQVCEWNDEFGKPRWEWDAALEAGLLEEESAEAMDAMAENDIVEIIDGCVDTIVVAIGNLHARGLTPEQIQYAIQKVVVSNNTKLPMSRDKNGKIVKSANWIAPDFTDIINNLNS